MPDRVTALDIERQQFRSKLRGYDAEEVRLYLKAIAEEVERLNLDNGRLREEAGALRDQLEQFRSREQTLQATLVTAQRMAEEIGERGRAQSELVVREARMKAERLLQQAQDQLARLETEIAYRRIERDNFERRLRGLIDEHLALLDARETAATEVDNVRVLRRAGTDAG